MKFGRIRPEQRPKLSLSKYLLDVTPPSSVDYSAKATNSLSQMYGNDQLGDCVIAGGGHVRGVTSSNAGSEVIFTDTQIISMYSAACGYMPGNPSTDRGCDEQQVLSYWQNTGFPDGVKLAGFVGVDATNKQECETTLYLFENLFLGLELPDGWTNPMPSASGFVWDVAGSPNPSQGHCFTGDTKVSLLDGTERSFAELASGSAGETFGVYSCDEKGNIVAGNAHSVRKTRENTAILKVGLDNGEFIKCTPDHKFLMRDGSYKEASQLQPNDSLMPLYRRTNGAGYELFYNPSTKGWKTTHRIMAFGHQPYPEEMAVHHKDFDKRNNDPTNLEIMTGEEHMRLHEMLSGKLKKYAQSDEGRQRSRELMRKLWSDPVWAERQRERLAASAKSRCAAAHRNGAGFENMASERLNEFNKKNTAAHLQSEENQIKSTLAWRKKWLEDEEFREKHRNQAVLNLAKSHGKPITEKQRQARRENVVKARANKCANNHKVTSVESAGYEDVYDMTVDKYHNFALSAGVFVHNCIMAMAYNDSGIKVSTWGMTGTMTWNALSYYCVSNSGGELYTMLSPDMINAAIGKAPNGLNWSQLLSDLSSLGGNPSPSPSPPSPVPPSPSPTPTPIPVSEIQAAVDQIFRELEVAYVGRPTVEATLRMAQALIDEYFQRL